MDGSAPEGMYMPTGGATLTDAGPMDMNAIKADTKSFVV
jgi:hypothetical protein